MQQIKIITIYRTHCHYIYSFKSILKKNKYNPIFITD